MSTVTIIALAVFVALVFTGGVFATLKFQEKFSRPKGNVAQLRAEHERLRREAGPMLQDKVAFDSAKTALDSAIKSIEQATVWVDGVDSIPANYKELDKAYKVLTAAARKLDTILQSLPKRMGLQIPQPQEGKGKNGNGKDNSSSKQDNGGNQKSDWAPLHAIKDQLPENLQSEFFSLVKTVMEENPAVGRPSGSAAKAFRDLTPELQAQVITGIKAKGPAYSTAITKSGVVK